MLFLRVTPSLPNLFINLASPIVDIPFHIFFLATVVGLVPASYITVRVSLFLFDFQNVMNREFPFLNLIMLFATVFASTRPGLLLVNWNRWKIYTMSRPWPYFSSSGPFYYFRPFWRGSGCTSRALVYNYSLQNLCGIGETHPWFSTLIRGTKQAKSSSLTNRRRCCSWLPASNKSSPRSAIVLQKSWLYWYIGGEMLNLIPLTEI